MLSTASSTTPNANPKPLYLDQGLDQGPQQNHRRRKTRAPSVRFHPLGELANQLIGLECRLRRALVGTRVMPPAPLAGD
jgi:hypothetical protein